MWLLVPLGNPGPEYADTRHNLGRLMLMRWMQKHVPAPRVRRRLGSGTLYDLKPPFQALVPSTYMNLSGLACAEAAATCDPGRMILLYDDKDLPLGLGRFRQTGSDGGHNGLKSVFAELQRQDLARLRLGIGPFQRPLVDFVLGRWSDPEWAAIDAMDAPFARFMDLLGSASDLGALSGTVNPDSFWHPPLP
ncbi:MAG: aminoacyl-tRNA hydrolase [Holophaga sp.]|nr:aminoacyl-tRNA hydrolase [Holophaga sp.]